MIETLIIIIIILTLLVIIQGIFGLRKYLSSLIDRQISAKLEIEQKQLSDRFQLAYLALEKEIERKIFERFKNDNTQIKKNPLAKNEEISQTSGDDFWRDINKLKDLRESIGLGNTDDYRSVTELANLPPLDAWQTIDAAIAELESSRRHPAYDPNNK